MADWRLPAQEASVEHSKSCIRGYLPPGWLLRRLHRRLASAEWEETAPLSGSLSLPAELLESNDLVVYASRGEVARRRIVGEHRLVNALRSEFGDRLVVHSADGMDLSQQRALWSHARTVVGMHGAALSNLIFANSGYTRVVEFPTPSTAYQFYSYLAASLDMPYWAVFEASTGFFSNLTLDHTIIDAILETTKLADQQPQ
jgi:Glycosyltransferase 61